MIPHFQMWCFDLDGTLIDQSARYIAVHEDLIKELGGQPASQYIEKRRSGISEVELFKSAGVSLNKLQHYDYRREQLLESWPYLHLDTLFPGVIQILTRLKAVNSKTWIITHRGYSKILAEQLDTLGLTKLITGWDNTKTEPNGSIIEMSDEGRNIAANEKGKLLSEFKKRFTTIMVGDSPSDIKAANLAQVPSIAIPTGLYSISSLRMEKPSYIYNSLEELNLSLFD